MGWQSLDVELRALVKEWEAKKHKIDKELEALHTAIRINQERGSESDAGGRRASTYAQELTDAIHDTLLSERPLHRNVILEKVAERGIHVGGTKPVNSIGSYLSTDSRFKNCGRGLWTLVDEATASTPSSSNETIGVNGTIRQIPSFNISDFVSVPDGEESEIDDLPF